MDALHRRQVNVWRKSLMATTQECCEQYWTSLEGSTTQSSICTATYHPSRKLSKLDEPDMRGHCWRSRDELIKDILLWTPAHGRAMAGFPAKTYIQQLRADTGCGPGDLPEATDGKERWWERARDIRADGATYKKQDCFQWRWKIIMQWRKKNLLKISYFHKHKTSVT